jgi:predicted acylesterase/phospholipase RssA
VAENPSAAATSAHADFGQTFEFHQVFRQEIDGVVNVRRRRVGLADIELIEESEDVTGQPILTPREGSNVVGLALSGGGIRSAAFCLGVLQALDPVDVLRRVDYLSTVSGGGYIGCSLTAAL